jgi:hypothetical protein
MYQHSQRVILVLEITSTGTEDEFSLWNIPKVPGLQVRMVNEHHEKG